MSSIRIVLPALLLVVLQVSGPAAHAEPPDEIAVHLELLKEEDFELRRRAIEALVAVGPEVFPHLVDLRDDEKSPLRPWVDLTLERLERNAQPTWPAFVALLDHEDSRVRKWACQVLGRTRADPALCARRLAELTRDEWNVAKSAAWALGHTGADGETSIAALEAALDSNIKHVPFNAATSLCLLKRPDPRATAVLLDKLKNQGNFRAVREALTIVLPEALPDVVARIVDPTADRDVRGRAANILNGPDLDLSAHAGSLATLLDDADDGMRGWGALLVAKCGDAARPCVPRLIELLAGDTYVSLVVGAFETIGLEDEGVLEALLALTKHPKKEPRMRLARTLTRPGQSASLAARTSPGLIALLQDPVEDVRKMAGRAAVRAHPYVVPLLFGLLETCDAEVAAPVQQALSARGKEVAGAVAGRLKAAEDDYRLRLLQVLTGIGRDAETTAFLVTPLLAVEDAPTRDAVKTALRAFGPRAAPIVAAEIAGGKAWARASAVEILPDLEPDEKTVARLGRRLSDRSGSVRTAAARALESLGEGAAPALPSLSKALRRREEALREPVKAALVACGAAAVSRMKDLLRSPDPALVDDAAAVLRGIGAEAAPAAPMLRRLLKHDDPVVQGGAALTLAKLGHAAESSVPDLVMLLEHPRYNVRYCAREALLELGPHAYKAIPRVVREIHDETSDEDADSMGRALGAMGERALPAIRKLQKARGVRAQRAFEGALTTLGRHGMPFFDEITAGLSDPSEYEREQAVAALAALGPPAQEPLARATRDEERDVREAAGKALAALGPPALDALLDYLRRAEKYERHPILEGIGAMGEGAAPAVPLLLEMALGDWYVADEVAAALAQIGRPALYTLCRLSDRDTGGAKEAAAGLAAIGPDAWIALPALVKLAEWPNYREAANAAIRAIRAEKPE